MKKYIIMAFALVFTSLSFAQENPVKIVFDVTSNDAKVHQATIRHVKFMSKSYPDSKFEVVMYSGSYDMAIKAKSSVAEDLEALAKNENISFVICEATMKRHKITPKDLIPGISSVPDGILEIILKQKDGWGYIKEAQ